MPQRAQLDQLKAKEAAAKAALETQRKALKAAQAQRKAAEQKLLHDRWRDIGRLAEEAGLGILDLDVLPAAFAYLAAVAQDPAQVQCWRNAMTARDCTRFPTPIAPPSRMQGDRDAADKSAIPSFAPRDS